MMKQKKGELATQQIVMLIILITSFAILLFLLVRLDLGKTTEKEICHNSVIARGSSVLPEGSIPLDCRRAYVCISADGTCKQMTKPDLKKVKTEEEVYNILAEEMVTCWWMFGEGKVDYVKGDLFEQNYCSICSQIAFDDSITELFGADTIDKGEFYGYLASNNVSGRGITYSEYLVKTENLLQIHEGGFGKINLENQYYVLMGIKSKVSKEKWIGGGAAAGVVFLGVLSVVSAPVSVGIISSILYAGAGAATGNFFAAIVEGESGNQYISPTVIEVNSEEFKDLNCKSIVTLA